MVLKDSPNVFLKLSASRQRKVSIVSATLSAFTFTLRVMAKPFPENEIAVNNGVLTSLIIVLFLLYLGLSVSYIDKSIRVILKFFTDDNGESYSYERTRDKRFIGVNNLFVAVGAVN